MHKVYISDTALISLDYYIQLYEDYMIKPFYDTGMGAWVESIIRSQYATKAESLFLAIYDHIIARLASESVLWYRPNPEKTGECTLITTVENRTIIIEYQEDLRARTRTIFALQIFRE